MSDYIREAFDGDDIPKKNIALRKAHDEIERLNAENARLREALLGATAALTAAISLLERSPSGKKSAPSDKMFEMMLSDYRRYAEQARAALAEKEKK